MPVYWIIMVPQKMMFMENPSKPNILGIIIIQERGIPFLTNQSNKKTEGI
jgi:hypothetical protein